MSATDRIAPGEIFEIAGRRVVSLLQHVDRSLGDYRARTADGLLWNVWLPHMPDWPLDIELQLTDAMRL